MAGSYLNANTYGIGAIIEQRGQLEVPDHQRDFTWSKEDVTTFIEDVLNAMNSRADDYFVGLIVLVQPTNIDSGAWQILDGQQRIATTTMVFASIREWLHGAGKEKDASKTQSDFIGMSEYGETDDLPRLTLNINNRTAFQTHVVNRSNDDTLVAALDHFGKKSSDRRLIEAAIVCRRMVRDYALSAGGNPDKQAGELYRLAKYLKNRVKAVCMDVSTSADAYIIFESLNDRGLDLSILDLVKNHTYGRSGRKLPLVQANWASMVANIGDREADDFLKVFWTSQYGRVQRGALFQKWKLKYRTQADVTSLSRKLVVSAERFSALDAPDADVWSENSNECRSYLKSLRILGNRQVRPIIMAAIDAFSEDRMEKLLHHLLIAIVRYQTIGKGRTGALEITCAKIAHAIHDKKIKSPLRVWNELKSALRGSVADDQQFREEFERFSESNSSRARYLLRELERTHIGGGEAFILTESTKVLNLEHILPKKPGISWSDVKKADPDVEKECVHRIGNLCLLETKMNRNAKGKAFSLKAEKYYDVSEITLTNSLSEHYTEWNRDTISERQTYLSELALETWPQPEGG